MKKKIVQLKMNKKNNWLYFFPNSLSFVKEEFSDLQESTVGNQLSAKSFFFILFKGAVFLPHALELNEAIIKFDIWDTAGNLKICYKKWY